MEEIKKKPDRNILLYLNLVVKISKELFVMVLINLM